MNFGRKRESAGDADALPLSPGKLVGIARARRFVQTHRPQEFADSRANVELRPPVPAGVSMDDPTITAPAMNDERLGDNVFHVEPRIERSERILKNNLQVAPQAAHFAPPGREQIAALKTYRARSRLNQPENQPPQRALS